MEIYARNILDQFIDLYSMINGFEASEEHWAHKQHQYLGSPMFLTNQLSTMAAPQQPLQLRFVAWRSEAWLHFQMAINKVCSR